MQEQGADKGNAKHRQQRSLPDSPLQGLRDVNNCKIANHHNDPRHD